MVFVSSPKHIKELDNTSDTILSLNGAAKHVRFNVPASSEFDFLTEALDAPTHIYNEWI